MRLILIFLILWMAGCVTTQSKNMVLVIDGMPVDISQMTTEECEYLKNIGNKYGIDSILFFDVDYSSTTESQ